MASTRTPLALKDSNVYGSASSSRRSSPLKSSPLKAPFSHLGDLQTGSLESLSSSLRQENCISPSKRHQPSAFNIQAPQSPSKKLRLEQEEPQETFHIYEDPEDYGANLRSRFSHEVNVSSVPVEDKENSMQLGINRESNSENALNDRIPQTLYNHVRSPLTDLPITDFPGFMQDENESKGSGILHPKCQLKNSWVFNFDKPGKFMIPSFVTPPKKRYIDCRYVTSLEDGHVREQLGRRLRRALSVGSKVSKPKKHTKSSLSFTIYNDAN